MATLYKIDPVTLEIIMVADSGEYFELPGVVSIKKFKTITETDVNILKDANANFDTFYSNCRADSDIHYHDDEELRLIIQGSATFYIHHDEFLYIADCGVLELVELQPDISHWFTSDNELLVYRFFKNNNSRVAYEPEFIPEYLINIKNHIDKYGRRFKI